MTQQPQGYHRVPVQLTPDQHEYLRARAFRERSSIASIIRDLVDERRHTDDPQLRLTLELDRHEAAR